MSSHRLSAVSARITIAVAAISALTGCLQMEQNVLLNPDNTGRR